MCENFFLERAQYFKLNNFKFSNGQELKDVDVEYISVGTPQYDDEGNISNAIVYCHGSSGNFASLYKLKDLVNKDGPFDKDKYFFISLTCLGKPGSCSPSTTKLFQEFPHYEVEDMVNFHREFLKEKFSIEKVKGVIGNSKGGYVALSWAALYPDTLDFVVSMVSSYKTAGHNYILSKLMDELIVANPKYGCEKFDASLNVTLKMASLIYFNYGFSKEFYRKQDNHSLDVSFDEFGDESLFDDIYDVKFENDAVLHYDIEDKLGDIKAKTLIIAINQDQYFPPELDGIPMSKMIENSTLIRFDSELGHVGSNEIYKIEKEIKEFMDSL